MLENKSTNDTALQTDNETSMLSELDISLPLSPGTMSIVDTLLTEDVQPPDLAINIDQMQSQSEIRSSAQSAIAMQAPEPINVVTVKDLEPGATLSAKLQKAKQGQADKSKWMKIKRKRNRMFGVAYSSTTKSGDGEYVVKEPRIISERCSSKRCCKSKRCNEFSEEDRQRIFHSFWKELDWGQRKVYVASLADMRDVGRKKVEDSRRQCSITYYLRKDGERLKVCREMFLSTLCLGEWSVRNWVMSSVDGMHSSTKERPVPATGRHNEALEKRELVRKFFSDLPKLPSHYCRASTSKKYLEPHFQSVAEVYRLFEKQQATEVPSRQVFTEEFHKMNIGLYMPKKDQCDKYSAYKVGSLSQEDYDEHIARKEEARTSKAHDKKRAEEGQCHALTVDVQAVQLIPYLQASALYFKQKLAVHNFTVYNLNNDDVVCYVWHEGEGELNAHIFASCLTNYLETEINCDKEIVIYSDGCGSQNRNATLSNALSFLARRKGVSIIQKYLEKRHTQMECDSVHGVIERRKKHRDLHSPAQYVQLIKEARLRNPYKVYYLQHNFFRDFSKLIMFQSITPGRKVGDPTAADLRCIKYLPAGDIQWKIRHTNEWQLLLQPRRSTVHVGPEAKTTQLYSSPIPIKREKYRDLQSLKNVILPDFHAFYDSLSYQ